MRLRALVGVILAAALAAPPSQAQDLESFEDPIALTGHGSIFDSAGRQIEATPEFLAATMEAYVRALLERADAETRTEFAAFSNRVEEALATADGDAQARSRLYLLGQVGLVEWLAAQQPPGAQIDTNVKIVKYLIETIGVAGAAPTAPPPALEAVLQDIAAPGGVMPFSTLNEGQAYIDECAANGVPIPPDWGSSQWTEVGSLGDADEFISQEEEARVFKFKSVNPPGTCIALPRFAGNGSGDIVLLGMICLGTQTSKACFWDNQSNDSGFPIGPNESVPLSDFAGGAELDGGTGGTCTACHAGENPYIIHPGTALGQPALGDLDLMADDWADPLVHPDWPQNPGPSVLIDAIPGVGQCTSCHSQAGGAGRFPQMSSSINGYCGIFGTAVEGANPPQGPVDPTMPPASPGSAAASSHVVAMRALCSNVATPLLRVDAEVLDYGEVDLGFAFAKALVVHNDGDANLTVSVNRVTPANDPDLAQWSEITEVSNVAIAPGDPPLVLRQTYEPQDLGAHTVELEVISNDSAAPDTAITLTGEGVTPRPVDSLLVIDRSGSMADLAGDRTKIEAMRDAVMLYTDLLRDDIGGTGTGDQLGFVKYNDANSVYMPMTGITSAVQDGIRNDELSDGALNDINELKPDGTTGIGGAMLTGAGELGGPDPDRGKVMVVLTDGKENETPTIATAIADIQANAAHLQTYSVGLGFDIEPTKLQSITNMGDEGYHQVVSTLQDETLFDLETFYFKIFSSATGLDLVTDPTHVVNLASGAPVIVDHARVVSSDRSATFLILDDPMMRQLYSLEFIAPDGAVLTPGSSIGGIPIHEQSRNTYRIFRIIFPDPSQDDTYVGDWTLRLVPDGSWTRSVGRNLAAESQFGYDGFLHPMKGQVPIGFAGAVASNYHLEAGVTPSGFLPGATLRLDAALTDRGWPAPDGDVTVTITRPDAVVHNVVLHDDGAHGDGDAGNAAWANAYDQTAPQGVYKLLFRSIGRNERGELAPRLLQRYVTLQEPEPDPRDPRDPPGGGGTRGCSTCEGSAAAYLIGSYDLNDGRNVVHVINPTERTLDIVVALFDDESRPSRCARGTLGPNDIQEFLIDRLDPPSKLGVVKVVALRPGTRTPVVGIVGNQSRVGKRGAMETGLHPISRAILEGDLPRILEACQ